MRPNLGGLRWGRTPNMEVNELYQSLSSAEAAAPRQAIDGVLRECQTQAVEKSELTGLRQRLAAAEEAIGRQLAHTDARRSPRGRHWQMPERRTAGHGRDWLALEVQKCGLTFQEARLAVRAVFKTIQDALKTSGEIETPLGTLRVVDRPARRQRLRWGKMQQLYRRRKTVVLVPPGAKERKRKKP